ncbi:ATP-binding protein [Embleya sp. AB8]|uniref:ATP-binding protein n=1 Tax=Embleya sp. AB8 TaxID=3156304 RepID=UPI003C78B028
MSVTRAPAHWACAPLKTSVPNARHQARREIESAGFVAPDSDAAYSIELAVTELVTNAVHAFANAASGRSVRPASLIDVCLRWTSASVVVEVTDELPGVPTMCPTSADDESGRGLALVALLGTWGVRPTPVGKTVWCEIPYEARGVAC